MTITESLKLMPMAPYVFLTEETTEADIWRYLTDIKACGFTAVRPGASPVYLAEDLYDFQDTDLFFSIATKVGLDLFPHFQLGFYPWMALPPHNIDPATCLLDDEYHRLVQKFYRAVIAHYRDHPRLLAWVGIGEPGDLPATLAEDPRFKSAYVAWLQQQYGTLEQLTRAWGQGGRFGVELTQWDCQQQQDAGVFQKYRHRRDLQRFTTEFLLEKMTTNERVFLAEDCVHPMVTGVHNMLCNAAGKAWDFELQASRADGLMSSIHASWHNWLAENEFTLPLYVQARMTRDFAKGKWAIPYETTGGGTFRTSSANFNMHAGEHTHMMLCYLAAGLQGAGFWSWNCRLTGYEAGEYGLTTLQGAPSPRAHLLGAFARHIAAQRVELYDSQPERVCAVLYSWESEMFCQLDNLVCQESMQADSNSRKRLGTARALVNANIPFEFVTDTELVAGQVAAYPVLIVPGMPVVTHAAMAALATYVQQGGTLIMDAPFAAFDENSRIRTEGEGGEYDRLLGAYPLNHAATFHEARTVNNHSINGVFSSMAVTTAEVLARFDDGRPAMLAHQLGKGRVLFFAFEVTRHCATPGNAAWESFLVQAVMQDRQRSWECADVMAVQRHSGTVDYYYLINTKTSAVITTLRTFSEKYVTVRDVLAERDLPVTILDGNGGCQVALEIPAGMGCWLRCER